MAAFYDKIRRKLYLYSQFIRIFAPGIKVDQNDITR